PIQMTSFIGRDNEIAEIKQALIKTRLVTLTGSGGTGKTRLSIQVATEILEHFKDGIWFIELAAITDPELVPNAVANTLGVREQSGQPIITTLIDWFRDRELLLILDNCEHMLDACARLVDQVLHGSQETRILASSREALGIAGETAFRVPSLPTPNTKEQIPLEQLEECESVRLFMERAAQTLPTFKVTSDNALALTQICHRLDGIPLAIELAAARVKVLSVEQIAERLDDRFRLLTGGSRTALPRQQTLRALIDWSYQLLSEQERLLFRRLAVFVGGWTLEAAEAVCGFGGIESIDVLDLLSHLVDKSLVIVENVEKESRYRRLETIRQYAREKLFETDEAAQIRDRHFDYFRMLAEKAEIEILNANQVAWLKRLDVEFDNIRAALEWSQEKRVEDGLRLGSAIWRFCLRYGYTNELVEKLNQLLQHPQGSIRTLARAKTLCILTILTVWQSGQSDPVRQRALAKEGFAIYKELGNQNGEAAGLYAMGVGENRHGDPEALSFLLQSLALYRSINDKTDICDVLIVISHVSSDPVQRQACLEEALVLARERGDAITMAGALDNLGLIAMDLGNFSQARAWLEESLELQLPLGASGYITTLQYLSKLALYEDNLIQARAYGEEVRSLSKKSGMTMTWQYLFSLANLGYIALREGNIVMAKETFRLSIQQFQKANRLDGVIFAIEGVASLNVNQEHFERAARFFTWADAMREKISDQRPPNEQQWVERDMAVIYSHLDAVEFEKLSAEGRSMTVEQVIALATES
ncbi:MAG: ATP-binding protein, partial [Byssovorax cruenta]